MMKIGYENTLLTRKVLLQNPEHLRQQGMLTIMTIAYIGKVSLPYLLSRQPIRSQIKRHVWEDGEEPLLRFTS